MSRCAMRLCGESTFADFDHCAEHVPQPLLLEEITYLRTRLAYIRDRLSERPRNEHHHAAPAHRSETTILERM